MELWNRLDDYAQTLSDKFDTHFHRYDNPKYTEDLHFAGWNDTFWHSDEVYKCHLKTIKPEDGKGLWLMHINIFPEGGYELPILGFDIVAGPKKITGSFMDFSPLHGHDHVMHEYMRDKVEGLEWNKPRELPPWAKEIFSDNMLAVGNIRDGEELDQFMAITNDLVDYYLNNLEQLTIHSERDTIPILNKYCTNQKMNPHLHRSILAMGISEEDKDRYVNNVLFEVLDQMRIAPVAATANLNRNPAKKQLTINGCCDKVNIISVKSIIPIGKHKFMVTVAHCEYCGQVKATSNIQEYK